MDNLELCRSQIFLPCTANDNSHSRPAVLLIYCQVLYCTASNESGTPNCSPTSPLRYSCLNITMTHMQRGLTNLANHLYQRALTCQSPDSYKVCTMMSNATIKNEFRRQKMRSPSTAAQHICLPTCELLEAIVMVEVLLLLHKRPASTQETWHLSHSCVFLQRERGDAEDSQKNPQL